MSVLFVQEPAKKELYMRPKLDKKINPENFDNYYWLKEELFEFCKKYSISSRGSKQEITERISYYLRTGKVLNIKSQISKKIPKSTEDLLVDSKISDIYKNDEKHRVFFKSIIGEHFKFNVKFMNWMKKNSGKTYQDAVDEWFRLEKEKKSGKKLSIAPQFEYNQYTRDFFQENKDLSREDAIKCWKYKKSLSGSNKYEKEDLKILTERR